MTVNVIHWLHACVCEQNGRHEPVTFAAIAVVPEPKVEVINMFKSLNLMLIINNLTDSILRISSLQKYLSCRK